MSRPVIEMEDLDTLCKGYVVLGSRADKKQSDFMPKRLKNQSGENLSQLPPPVDKFNGIYFALVLAGVGFLLPYNSFIIAADYFMNRYPGTTIVFDMSLLYILVGSVAVLINNALVEVLSVHTRIIFGYVVAFFTLMFVATCEIWWEIFSAETSYTFNLAAVGVVALGCTVQQSSFYGYTSMLPSRYTQAVMTGESAAGFIISLNRIITKLLLDDQRINTLIFFVLSMTLVGCCSILHHAVRNSSFVKFYMNTCREGCKVTLEPTEDVSLMEPAEAENLGRNQYGMLKLQHGSTGDSGSPGPGMSKYSGYSFANPVYEPGGAPPILPVTTTTVGSSSGSVVVDEATGSTGSTGIAAATGADAAAATATSGPTYKVEDVIIKVRGGSVRGPRPTLRARAFGGLERGLEARWMVARAIWPYMLSIALAYFVTLCLYPGIEAEIISCKYGSWIGVILMAIFNASDLLGKVLASVPYEWSRVQLLVCAALRILLVPLLLMCATPRGNPMIGGEYNAMLLSMLIGLTNGIVGSLPMILAPSRVPEERRELAGLLLALLPPIFATRLFPFLHHFNLAPYILCQNTAGNIMTLSYNFGLTSGSLAAYWLNKLIGIGEGDVPACPGVPPYISIATSTAATAAASAAATAAATITNATASSFLYNLTTTAATTLSTALTVPTSSTQLATETAASTSAIHTMLNSSTASTLVTTVASIFNATNTSTVFINATKS